MPFHLSELELDDCAEFAELDAAAMANWPMASAMEIESQKKGESRKKMIERWMQEGLKKNDPNGIWLKVTDSETGQMAAAAGWKWQLEDVVPDVVLKRDDEQSENKPLNIFGAMRSSYEEFEREFFPSQKHFGLMVLCTHPKWQRRGAGSMLVKYGCDKADEAGVICVLQATEAGHGLYMKNGFEVVRAFDFDCRPFGVDAIEHRRSMIRQPKK